MKNWSVWSEGYAATGNSSDATFHGEWPGESFKDACEAFCKAKGSLSSYDRERNTIWACRFFDNEADARKRFG